MFPILTVRETLVFAALLRLSHKMSHREKVERAETVLRELGLERCKLIIIPACQNYIILRVNWRIKEIV